MLLQILNCKRLKKTIEKIKRRASSDALLFVMGLVVLSVLKVSDRDLCGRFLWFDQALFV